MEEIIVQVASSAIVLLYPFWRIFKRAGLNPALSLLVLLPLLGILVCGLILSVSTWKLYPSMESEK